MEDIPSGQEALADLSGAVTTIWSGLDSAILETKEFFENRGVPIDRSLAPNLIRYFVKGRLNAQGKIAEDEEMLDYEMQNLPNNGLCMEYGRYQLRILKADNGELPIPGQSKKRQAFWNQEQLNLYDDEQPIETVPSVNLIVLWDADSSYNLDSVSLICPKTGGTTRDSVSNYWSIPVPNPIMQLSPAITREVEEDDDIIITPLRGTTSETGNAE